MSSREWRKLLIKYRTIYRLPHRLKVRSHPPGSRVLRVGGDPCWACTTVYNDTLTVLVDCVREIPEEIAEILAAHEMTHALIEYHLWRARQELEHGLHDVVYAVSRALVPQQSERL
jgi:hypothetical protein